MFTIADWRDAKADLVGAALAAEAGRWRSDLAWDVGEAWQSIEPARRSGSLPGFLAVDFSGRVVGWTCYLLHHGTLQVAVLTARAPEVTSALVHAILSSPDAQHADVHSVCVRDAAPLVRETLTAHGFSTVTYRYLTLAPKRRVDTGPRTTDTGPRTPNDELNADHGPRTTDHGPIGFRPFVSNDFEPVVRLCARAYPSHDVRAFAPLGSDDEWRDYVRGLTSGPGCGRLVADASRVLDGRTGIEASVIATDLGLGTGHIAQVVVDPALQGRGIGTALVSHAADIFASRGYARVTLLVSADNQRAARVYAGLGFRNRASFVVAVNRQPWRQRAATHVLA